MTNTVPFINMTLSKVLTMSYSFLFLAWSGFSINILLFDWMPGIWKMIAVMWKSREETEAPQKYTQGILSKKGDLKEENNKIELLLSKFGHHR